MAKKKHPLQMLQRTVLRMGQTAFVSVWAAIKYQTQNKTNAQLLRETFEQLGTTYIKLGQLIASSPSLFPREYVEEFQKCLDQTPAISFDKIKQQIEDGLGKPINQVYAFVDEKPLASASIAQVHAAQLLTGEDVVIKVQKPGVGIILKTDLTVVHTVLQLLEKVMPQIKMATLSGIIDEIRSRMLLETDFVEEAKNIRDFEAFLLKTQNRQVVVPQVYDSASSKTVLTMERFYGVPLTDTNQMKAYTKDPAETLITTMNTWFASLMQCPTFHADLHAANVMLLKDGRIGFIDFGIVGKLKPDSWSGCVALMDAISNGDYRAMAPAMLQMGMTDCDVDVDLLANDLEQLFNKLTITDPTAMMMGDLTDMNKLMLDLVGVGEKHGIHFPRDFALLIKQMLYFDRFMQVLTPHIDVFSDQRMQLLPEQFQSLAYAAP